LGGRSETAGKFRNVVLENSGDDTWTDRVRNEEVLQRVKVKVKHTRYRPELA
jgi:hypothetical protein